jgi:methionine-rich copper-binding protein CopC
MAGAAVLVALSAALGIAGPASAHNYLLSSTPTANGTLTTLPSQFSVVTSGLLLNINRNGTGFALQVRDAAGLYYGNGCVEVDGAAVRQAAAIGAPGKYTVTWQVISTDGHIVSDTFAFTWAPTGDYAKSVGKATPPDCNGKFHLNATGLPPAGSGTGSSAVSDSTLSTVLWIGGAVLAVGVAVVVTLVVTARRRRPAA